VDDDEFVAAGGQLALLLERVQEPFGDVALFGADGRLNRR
jgi:hypothetical protein